MSRDPTPVPSTRTGKAKRFLNLALLAAAIMAFSFQALAYRYVSDDAYISFRYAQNWSRGFGPVYNVGEKVEGYTNFLWVAVLTGLHALGADIVLSAQVLGITFGVAVILLTYRFSLRWHSSDSLWAVLAACMLALNVSFAAWATGGLETHLFASLVLLAAFLELEERDKPSRFPCSALVWGLAMMTRPDALVFVALSGLCRLWRRRGRITRQDLLWGLTLILVYVPYYVWRFIYYGYPLPNTFYAKTGGGPERFLHGWRHVRGWLMEYGGGPFAVLAGLLVILRKLDRDCTYLALLAGGYMAYVVWVGGDALIEYRFLLVVTPLLYLLIQQSLWTIYGMLERWRERRAIESSLIPKAILSAMLLALVYLLVAQASVQTSRSRVAYTRIRYDGLAMAGRWFRAQVPGDASVAVILAGAMPFYSELPTIDMLGLNDLHIAHREMPDMGTGFAGHEKYDVDYVLSRQPTYIAPLPLYERPLDFEEWHFFDDNLWFLSNKEMLGNPVFQSSYASRSLDFGVLLPPDQEDILSYGRFFNFFQRRDASLANVQEFVWDFGGGNGTAGWGPWAGLEMQEVGDSSVSLSATHGDPFMGISGLQLWATPCDKLSVRMRLTGGTEAQIFWISDLAPGGSEFQSYRFPIEPDGEFHTYEVALGEALSWAGTMTGLRLDPTDRPAEVEIDYIALERACETSQPDQSQLSYIEQGVERKPVTISKHIRARCL